MANRKVASLRSSATEAELKQLVSLLRATLESTADGILVVDAKGGITSFNRKFQELWRIPEEVVAARDDARALAFVLDQLKDQEPFLRKVKELYNAPDASSFDMLEFKDGRVFERYSQPQRIGGKSAGRVWSFRDVTERVRAERERLAAMERLQELERLKALDAFKTQFINTAAHELGTPLTPIKVQMHLLRRMRLGGQSEEERRALDILDRNLERLHQLVKDMLESARIQAGRLTIERAPVDVNRMVMEALETYQDPAKAAGVSLEVRMTPDLWVEGDAKRLTQVMFNLLSNALKFTAPGGRITVTTHGKGDEAWVEVRDTGSGLRPQDIPRLFQPFTQVHDTMQRTQPGAGLGLYISRSIVELHGGSILAESPGPGEGATFSFVLPTLVRGATGTDSSVAELAQANRLMP
jgi:PAS domain S-box-containing protein